MARPITMRDVNEARHLLDSEAHETRNYRPVLPVTAEDLYDQEGLRRAIERAWHVEVTDVLIDELALVLGFRRWSDLIVDWYQSAPWGVVIVRINAAGRSLGLVDAGGDELSGLPAPAVQFTVVAEKATRRMHALLHLELFVKGKPAGVIDIERFPEYAQVRWVRVDRAFQRQGWATKLYEQAAHEADQRWAVPLTSDYRLEPETEKFWRKQVSKGRAAAKMIPDTRFQSHAPRRVYQLKRGARDLSGLGAAREPRDLYEMLVPEWMRPHSVGDRAWCRVYRIWYAGNWAARNGVIPAFNVGHTNDQARFAVVRALRAWRAAGSPMEIGQNAIVSNSPDQLTCIRAARIPALEEDAEDW